MTLRHSVQHAVEGLADRITRVRYEIPPDCTFRAVVTGAADLVSISNVVAQIEGEEAVFPLPSGSGTLEIEIDANGADTNGYIQLEMATPSGDTYGFDGQAFETLPSIFEKKERFALARQNERVPFRLHPALNGFTATWTNCSASVSMPQIYHDETGGAAATIANATEIWASPGPFPRNGDISATLDDDYATESATLKVFSMTFEPITSETNALGKTATPSCVVVGQSGYFKATVSSNITNDEIVWSVSSEAAGLVTFTGRMAEVIPTACGTLPSHRGKAPNARLA